MSEVKERLNVGWVKQKDNFEFTKNFIDIIRFYLFSTPCDSTSSSWVSLNERKWSKGIIKKQNLRTRLLKIAKLDKEFNYKSVKKLDDISGAIKVINFDGNFQKDRKMNKIVFYNNSKQNEFMQLLYYIRCSLAHGRFERYNDEGGVVYVMEAVQRKTGEYFLRARMVLKEETLIEWRNIIVGGPDELDKKLQDEEKTYKELIIDTIKRNKGKVTKKIIIKEFEGVLNKSQVDRLIAAMKKNNETAYNSSKRTWEIRGNSH